MPQAPKSNPVKRPPVQKPAPKKAPTAKAKPAPPKAPPTKTIPAPQTKAAGNAGSPKAASAKGPAPATSPAQSPSAAQSPAATPASAPSPAPAPAPAPASAPASTASTTPTQPPAATPASAPSPAPAPAPAEGKGKAQDPAPAEAKPAANPLSNLWNRFGLGGTDNKPKPATTDPAQPQPGATGATPPANGDAGTASGNSGGSNFLDSVTGFLGGSKPPKLTPEQEQALSFARSMMAKEKLGGADGRFNQADVDAIAQAVARDRSGIKNLVLAQAKTALEYNVANEVLTNGVNGTGARRDILALADQRITNQVTGTIRDQLSASLSQQGVKGPADGRPDLTTRNVTIEEMARFEESMKVIEAMTKGKMSVPGMVATLPQGPSAQTFADIIAGRTVPEGVNVAFGGSTDRAGSTATAPPGGATPAGGAGTAGAPPTSLREQLRQAEIAAKQPKPSALPPDVRQAAEYVQYMLSSNKLGGGDLTLNHGDIPYVAGALRSDVAGIAPQVLAEAGGGIRGFAARRALNGHNGPFARRANSEIASGLYSRVQGQLGGSLSQSGITGNTRDNVGRNLTKAELEGFERSMAVVQRFGEQQAALNGFRINPPSSGIPQQMFSDLLNDRIPQYGSVQVTNPAVASGAGGTATTRPSTTSQPAPVTTGQPAPSNSGFGPGSNAEMKPSAMGANTYLGSSPSNHYVVTARGRVPIESYSPEMRRQFGITSNAPYIPPSGSGTTQPITTAQPVQQAPTQSSQPAASSSSQTSNSPQFPWGTSPSNRYVQTDQGLVPYETYYRNRR